MDGLISPFLLLLWARLFAGLAFFDFDLVVSEVLPFDPLFARGDLDAYACWARWLFIVSVFWMWFRAFCGMAFDFLRDLEVDFPEVAPNTFSVSADASEFVD